MWVDLQAKAVLSCLKAGVRMAHGPHVAGLVVEESAGLSAIARASGGHRRMEEAFLHQMMHPP